MTGFGRGDATWEGRGVRCELKTVNHKGLDVRVRLDRELSSLEAGLQRTLRGAFTRGRVDAQLVLERATSARGELNFDDEMADRLIDQLHKFARKRGDLGKHVELGQLLARSELFVMAPSEEEESRIGELVDISVAAAIADLLRTREAEGGDLAMDLANRLTLIEGLVATVAERAADAPTRLREKLTERLAKQDLADRVDADRLAQEVALLAERADVSEELTRLGMHTQRFRELAAGDVAVGRKLDFLCQELNREANTVASKCSDAATAHVVVELKAEIERVREQVQNVE